MKFYSSLLLSFSIVNLMGCASIINGTKQTVTVETRLDNEKIEGAQCELKNNGGKYYLTSPDSVVVKRTGDDLIVACKKDEHATGLARADSGLNGWVFGNVLLGGVIGLAVDAGTGSINDYPDLIVVNFGKNVFVKGNGETMEISEEDIYVKTITKKKKSGKSKERKTQVEN